MPIAFLVELRWFDELAAGGARLAHFAVSHD